MKVEHMAVVKGHYEVRRKMAIEIEELKKRIIELEAELRKLKEGK